METDSDISATVSRTELDSHANMCVLGRDCFVFDNIQDRTCDVEPFDVTIGKAKSVPIVDGVIAYDCPYSHQTSLLVVRNALYIPTMPNNLIPPFILREAGIQVKDIAKIHTNDPDASDHAITFPDDDLRIPLKLHGVFSYFNSRTPTFDEMKSLDPILLSPDGDNWNPYSDHFATNEESMLNWDGTMRSKKNRHKHVLDLNTSVPADDYETVVNATAISSFRSSQYGKSPIIAHESAGFVSALNARVEQSKMAMAIGSTSTTAINDTTDLFVFPDQEDYLQDEPFAPAFHHMDDFRAEIDAAQASKPQNVTSDFLSKVWKIKPEAAKKALHQTTQRYRQGADNSLSRQFSTNDRMLRYKRIQSQFFTDTLFVTSKGKSSRGNTCAQLFVSDKGFVAVYPMRSKSQYPDVLKLFCKEVGVPETLVVDPSGEQTSHKARQFCHKVGTTLRILEESTQWANRAELYIGLFKESIRNDISRTHCPMKFWDYCAERRARIHNVIPRDLFQLDGNNPTTATFGVQADISNICHFDWFDWCYFREESNVQFPFQKRKLGRILGPMKNQGNEMTQAVLTISGRVVPRRTCAPLTTAEIHCPVERDKRKQFTDEIQKIFGDSMSVPTDITKPSDLDLHDLTSEDDENEPLSLSDDDPLTANGTSVFEKPITDLLIHAEVLLPQGEEMKAAKVKGRAKDNNGDFVGSYDTNPFINTMLYDVEFPDGQIKQYSANIIAENMYSQVDEHGYSTTLFDSILDYKKDGHAIPKDKMFVLTKSGQKRHRQTTQGWKLLVRYKDESEQWIPLKILKETNPVDVAEFARAKDIDDEPAFAYWVPYTLRQRDRIIASINSRLKKTNMKYGIEIPSTLDKAKQLDRDNGDSFWSRAVDKEMANVKVAFEILQNEQPVPIGWSKSSGHLVFDVKMDFTRKARWVKDGHKTPTPEQSTYAGVVSRESVRIALTYAALNNINVAAADIKNAYLQAPSSEKHYIVCGGEFGLENIGKKALIRRALYGGKSSGADFWKHLRTCMDHLGFESCKADPDIWMRAAQKDDGTSYWEYVLLYVDDALCISMDATNVLNHQIGKYFYIKEGSVGPPTLYLGNKVSKVTLENGADAWSFSSSQYVQNAVHNVEEYLSKQNKALPKRATAPFSSNYRPETDTSPELDPYQANYYQSLIGVLRWIVELGRIDINVEASLMASCMALPRQGHLDQLFHIFAYLKNKHNTEMVFDPSEPDIDYKLFEKQDWRDTVYGESKEQLPPNMPQPRGQGFKLVTYVDSDHAGDSVTRRSRTGFIVYLNSSPIYWTSKKQTSIETSSFGSEFIAMKICCEYLRGLRYKLRMMGIPCDFPSYIFGDNQSVLANTTKPFSMLRKKSCSIAYHFVREGVSKDEWRTTYINTHDNVADILTKPLPGGEKRTKFIRMLLHHIQ